MFINIWEERQYDSPNSDIIANDASFANALSDVEPHQDFSGNQAVP